jgi:hypothetical protein
MRELDPVTKEFLRPPSRGSKIVAQAIISTIGSLALGLYFLSMVDPSDIRPGHRLLVFMIATGFGATVMFLGSGFYFAPPKLAEPIDPKSIVQDGEQFRVGERTFKNREDAEAFVYTYNEHIAGSKRALARSKFPIFRSHGHELVAPTPHVARHHSVTANRSPATNKAPQTDAAAPRGWA